MRRFLTVVALAACQPTTLPEEEGTTPTKHRRDGWDFSHTSEEPPPHLRCKPHGEGAWVYRQNVDKMRGTSSPSAYLLSKNAVDVGYGETRLMIEIVSNPKGDALGLELPRGQFSCTFDELKRCHIAYRFDEAAVKEDVGYGVGDSNNSMLLGTRNSSMREWLTGLCRGSHVTIEVAMFQHGRKQFEFDLVGLQWPPPTDESTTPAEGPSE